MVAWLGKPGLVKKEEGRQDGRARKKFAVRIVRIHYIHINFQ